MGLSLNQIAPVLSGVALMGAWGSGLFFFRFWRQTHDRFFFWLGAAFWTFALERLLLAFLGGPRLEEQALIYLIRLAGFAMILVAVYEKNRAERRARN